MILARKHRIDVEDLPAEDGLALPDAVTSTDVRRLRKRSATTSSRCCAVGGNRTQAAAKLGIGAATLYRKLKQYGESAKSK